MIHMNNFIKNINIIIVIISFNENIYYSRART